VSNKSKDFTSFLKCLSIFENKTATLYFDLAQKVDFPLVNALLMEISLDSQKHAALFKGISDSMPQTDFDPKQCSKKIGAAWQTTEDFIKEIAKKEKLDSADFPKFIEKIEVLEGVFGEEYNVFVQMKTLDMLAKKIQQTYKVNLDSLKHIFLGIIEDENHHLELIATIKQLVKDKDEEMMIADPLLRYRRICVPSQK
jgi:hypothetical protein